MTRYFALSKDGKSVIACNQIGKNVNIMDSESLEIVETIETPTLQVNFALEK